MQSINKAYIASLGQQCSSFGGGRATFFPFPSSSRFACSKCSYGRNAGWHSARYRNLSNERPLSTDHSVPNEIAGVAGSAQGCMQETFSSEQAKLRGTSPLVQYIWRRWRRSLFDCSRPSPLRLRRCPRSMTARGDHSTTLRSEC